MARSHEHIETQIIDMAREQASNRLKVPVGHTEIRGDTVVVRAGRKQVTYQIVRWQECDENGVPYLGGDRYKVEEVQVRTIPFWRRWLERDR